MTSSKQARVLDTRLQYIGMAQIATAALLWGTVGVVVGFLYTTSPLNASLISFYRMSLAVPALCAVLGYQRRTTYSYHVTRKIRLHTHRRDSLLTLLMGVILALYQLFYVIAIDHLGVAIATLVTLCSGPVFVALLSWLILRERLTGKILAALGLALTATALLSQPSGVVTNLGLGLVFATSSGLGYALVTLSGRHLAQRYPPLQTTTLMVTTASLTLLVPAWRSGLTDINLAYHHWLLLAYLGALPTAAAYSLFVTGMRHVATTSASIITLLEPLTATVLAWLFLAERLAATSLVAALLFVLALILLAAG
ncbi:MAG: EamA family transporter [Deinococcota bacterium]